MSDDQMIIVEVSNDDPIQVTVADSISVVSVSVGSEGTAGPRGADGAPGADGADGAPGADGADGAPGADGADGAPGADGAQGPSGVVTATSPLAYDSTTKTVSIGSPITPALGGAGLSNAPTVITTIGTINNQALATGWLVFTGNSYVSLTGLAAATNGAEVVLTNFLGAIFLTLEIQNGASASSAANRFAMSETFSIPYRCSARFRYNSAQARWLLVEQAQPYASATVAGLVSAQTQTFGGQKFFQNGFGLNGYTRGAIPHIGVSVSGEITQDPANLFFDRDAKRLGLQTGSPQGVGHFKSAIGTSVGATAGLAATLVLWTNPVAPSAFNVSAAQPDMQTVTSVSPAVNFGVSGYTADSSTYDFVVRAGYDDGVGNITWGQTESAAGSASDDGSFNPFGFDFSFAVGPSNFTPNVFSIKRQINGGGYTDYKRVTSSSFTEDNSGWTTGTDDFSTQFTNDYVSVGRTFNFSASAFSDSPIGTRICSSGSTAASFYDGNDGSAFKLAIDVSGHVGTPTVELDGAYHYDSGSSSFTASSSTWVADANPRTPTSYGLSGSDLNRTYSFYGSSLFNGSEVFSSVPYVVTTSDSSDGQFYYIRIDSFSPSTGKVLRDTGGARIVNGTTLYDDGVATWGASLTVLPTTYYPPATYQEVVGGTPSSVKKSTAADELELFIEQWLNAIDGEMASIVVDRDGMTINAPSVYIPNLVGGGGGGGSGDSVVAPGTTGAQTINKLSGRVNFAAGGTSLVVTNSLVTVNSIIQVTVATNDATLKSAAVVAGSGSFTIYASTAATAETAVNFTVTS